MQRIFGNTFPVREQLKQLGARWNPASRGWDVADDRANEARRIVVVGPTAKVIIPPKDDCPAELYGQHKKEPEPQPEPVYIPPPRCLSCGWQLSDSECRRCRQ